MAELVRDVVCGMEIDPDTAAAKSDYQGTTYYFCAVGCKQDFDADQQKYLGNGGAPAAEAPAASAPVAEQPVGASAGATTDKRWWEFWKS
jgi:Cu+-exporting ATPase